MLVLRDTRVGQPIGSQVNDPKAVVYRYVNGSEQFRKTAAKSPSGGPAVSYAPSGMP